MLVENCVTRIIKTNNDRETPEDLKSLNVLIFYFLDQ